MTWDDDLHGGDPLGFPGYRPPEEESVVTGRTEHYAVIEGRFDVLGGSMGSVHGERVVRAFRRATTERLPMVILASSGGARMQEGMVSLIQMARTAAASREHALAGLLQLAVLRSPTTGGVYASYASLADVRIAPPGATIGFAGPRVVELTTDGKLPPGGHTAEFAYDAGLLDAIVPEPDWPAWLEKALGLPAPTRIGRGSRPYMATESPSSLERGEPGASTGDAWGEVMAARAPGRWSGDDWASALCESWTPLRGPCDRFVCGLATLNGRRVAVVAMTRRQPRPADYRLAQRTIALAGRLGLPLVTLVDTPGADPRPDSESEGIASEIARTLAAMAELPSPSVSVCVGEGGSGGALALAFADRLLIQAHAVFSVIAPEGAAAILERDPALAPTVAERLRLTSSDLLALGIVDQVVAEPTDAAAMAGAIEAALDAAAIGARLARFDEATTRWLT